IEADPRTPRFILTVSGAGYKFIARSEVAETSEKQTHAVESGHRSETKSMSINRIGLGETVAPVRPGAGIASQHLEPEKRQLTVLCCGLAGTTGLAASFDLEEVGDVMCGFRHACTVAITRMGGSLARWIGEEGLALFGYPQAHEDDAERAVQA